VIETESSGLRLYTFLYRNQAINERRGNTRGEGQGGGGRSSVKGLLSNLPSDCSVPYRSWSLRKDFISVSFCSDSPF
jgi:hypothetical protein